MVMMVLARAMWNSMRSWRRSVQRRSVPLKNPSRYCEHRRKSAQGGNIRPTNNESETSCLKTALA
jgi:hypothetical protein